MGLLVGMALYPIISTTPRHKAIVWALRIASIPVAIILFVVLLRNFYTSDPYAGALNLRSGLDNTNTVSQPVVGADTCHAFQLTLIITVKAPVRFKARLSSRN